MTEPESPRPAREPGFPEPGSPELESMRRAMAALGEPHRFRLFLLLSERCRSVTELVEAAGTPQPLVSHHLSILCRAGVIQAERVGRKRVYRLSERPSTPVSRLLRLIREESPWPAFGAVSRSSRDDPAGVLRADEAASVPEDPDLEEYLL